MPVHFSCAIRKLFFNFQRSKQASMKTHIPASVKGFLLGFLLGLILLVAVIALYFGFLQEADRSHSSGGAQSANLPTSLSDSAEPTTHTPETTLPPSEPWEKLTFNLPWELHDQCPCNSSVLRRKQPQVAPGPTFLMLPLNIENRGLPPVPNYNGQISNSDLAYVSTFKNSFPAPPPKTVNVLITSLDGLFRL